MKDIQYAKPKELDKTSSFPVGLPRVVESAVSQTTTEVVGAIQLLMREISLPPKLFDTVYKAELSCRSLQGKINALVELYGGEDATGELRIASYSVTQFFTVVADQINKTLGDKIKGEVRFIPDEFSDETVSFDARRVCIILYHLIANAIKHGRTDNKNVEIRAVVKERNFELSVRDHGGGIPKEKIPTLFVGYSEPLSLKTIQESIFPPGIRGIGLPLCRKLTEDMQGELLFKNYKTGVKFTILLPQQENRFRETAVFLPDDTLLRACMADLLMEFYSAIQ